MPAKPAVLRNPFIRYLQANSLYELFFVSAIATILIMRTILSLTNYPQLGGDGLHIAHVLPGGILMLIAMVLLLGFLNKEAREIAAFLGGIGFGLFLDELGKFLTSNTNYFFEPTVALIYVVFVLLFLAIHWIGERRVSKMEYIVNAIETSKEVVLHDLDETEQRRALEYLNQADQSNPAVKQFRKLLKEVESPPPEHLGYLMRWRRRLGRWYQSIVKRAWFTRAVVVVFVTGSILQLGVIAYDIFSDQRNVLSFADWGELLSSGLASIFVVIGVYRLIRASRLAAYKWFERAVLISIFITQFFLFFRDQFHGLVGLVASLVVLLTLRYVIKQERYGR
ncbi:hypothetical protein EXS54_02020 [Patescibacteria group bacterium]|nr:hypothetical protein [Patescibacteria group bacterium]